jgi:isopenicillin N synthase-like dioxygenase
MVAAANIPVIDISDDANQLQVAKDLVEAAVEHGFIYIKNTGKDIPVDSVENAFNQVLSSYSRPVAITRCLLRIGQGTLPGPVGR